MRTLCFAVRLEPGPWKNVRYYTNGRSKIYILPPNTAHNEPPTAMKASKKWLDEYKNKHPDRVHDPTNKQRERDDEAVICEARWRFEVLPPTYNEVLSLQKYRTAEYYKKRNHWERLLSLAARDEAGPGAVIHTPTRIRMERYSSGTPDVDGLYGCFKIVLDALEEAALIPEDDPSHVAALEAAHRPSNRNDQHTILKFTPA